MIARLTLLLAVALPAAAAAQVAPLDAGRLGQTIESAEFSGIVLASRGDTIVYERAFGTIEPEGDTPHSLDERWRWASVTKQIVATIVMEEVEAGRISLDDPIADDWPAFGEAHEEPITIGQLLRHLSGLPNPDDTTQNKEGLPAFYTDAWVEESAATGYCAGPNAAEPGARYSYNNCDYIVLGGLLEHLEGKPLAEIVAERIGGGVALYPEGEPTVPGFQNGRAEPPIRLAAYGSAGGLNGTAHDLWQFDRRLMEGELLGDDARAELWRGISEYGYHALGQWAFDAPLAGCDARVAIVERRGAIGGIQARNYILPALDMALIAFTNRGEGEFDFGEIWQGAGFAYDLLSGAACPAPAEQASETAP